MRADHPALKAIRVFLAMVFISYGTVKLFGGQFVYDEWTLSRRTVDGPSLVWAFYGYSPVYARFVALCELVPAILLLVPRTAFLGAAALFPVVLNITVMDFTYGFPEVKYMALLYTVLTAVLLWAEREKLLIFVQPIHRVRAAMAGAALTGAPAQAVPRTKPLVRRMLWLVGLTLGAFLANLVAESTTAGPEERALQAARAQTGAADLVVKRSRYQGPYGIGRTAQLDLVPISDSSRRIRVYASRAFGFVPWHVDSIAR
jgi:uncharacterized membrane protein YphA (DoxX/SURF4 family)